jgi:hypothetical protein
MNEKLQLIGQGLHKTLSDFYVFATEGEVCDHNVINQFIQMREQMKSPTKLYTEDDLKKAIMQAFLSGMEEEDYGQVEAGIIRSLNQTKVVTEYDSNEHTCANNHSSKTTTIINTTDKDKPFCFKCGKYL